MRFRRKLLIAGALLPLTALLGLGLYAKYGDHTRRIERLANRFLDGRLSVAGRFEADVGFTTRIVAEDASLAAPEWSDAPATVHVDRLEGSVDLWSFVRGPVRVRDLTVAGARVVIEEDEHGRSSFFFGDRSHEPVPRTGPPDFGVVFEQAELSDVEVLYRGEHEVLDIVVDELELQVSSARTLALDTSFTINDIPLQVAGRLRTFDSLLAGEAIDGDLAGRLGATDFTLSGAFEELGRLADPSLDLEMSGADLAHSMRALGLAPIAPGSFHAEGKLRPADDGRVTLGLDVEMRNLHAGIQGVVRSLLEPGTFSLDIDATSTEPAGIELLGGVEGIPPSTLSVSGTLIRDADGLRVEEARASLGGNRITGKGIPGHGPRGVDTDFTFDAEGPDLSVFSELAGVELPRASYAASGRIVRRETGFEIDGVKARIGKTELAAAGLCGDWPEFEGTDLDLALRSPDASALSALVGLELPASPVELRGRVRPGSGVLVVEGVDGKLGRDTVQLEGTVVRRNGFVGTALSWRLSGPDLTDVATLLRLERLPEEPFDLAGHVRVLEDGFALDDVELRLGEADMTFDGKLVVAHGASGTDLRVHAVGPDVSRLVEYFGIEGWPVAPFEATGGVQVEERGYRLESVEARVGDIEFELAGAIASAPDRVGTVLDIEGRGPDLSELAGYIDVDALPSVPFAVRGRYETLETAHRFRDVAAHVGDHDLEVDGTLVIAGDHEGSEFVAKVSGPALDDAAHLLAEAELIEPLSLPPGDRPYEVSGDVRIESGLRTAWRRFDARVRKARFRGAGVLGPLPGGEGSDFSFEAEGPDGGAVAAAFGFELPHEPFSIRGRVARQSRGARFDDVKLRLGDHRAEIAGTLGQPPELVGTGLDVHFVGPDLELLSPYLDLPFSDAAYEISARFDGEPDRFSLTRLDARVGESDLGGVAHVDLRGEKPAVRAELVSRRFDVSVLQEPAALPVEPDEEANPGPEVAEAAIGELFIPDTPLQLEWLKTFDADIDWEVDQLETRFVSFDEARVEAQLLDGRLSLGPVRGNGEYGGSAVASLLLEPFHDGHRATATLDVEQLHLSLSRSADEIEQYSTHDGRVELQGHGRSLHEMAATAEGSLVIIQGKGAIDLKALGPLTRDLLREVGSSLRLSAREEAERLECGVHLYTFEGGKVTLAPFALVTDRTKVIGRGKLDLETEKIDLVMAAKPRKGIGLSASAVTNAYVKLGGTFSEPSLSVEPLRATVNTVAAWATGGLSFLGRAFWDRATSGEKICRKARKKAGFD